MDAENYATSIQHPFIKQNYDHIARLVFGVCTNRAGAVYQIPVGTYGWVRFGDVVEVIVQQFANEDIPNTLQYTNLDFVEVSVSLAHMRSVENVS